MTRGLWLFALVCALAAGAYALPGALKWTALAGLAFVYVATALPGRGEAEDSPELENGERASDLR